MASSHARDSRRSALPEIKLVPAVASLSRSPSVERRNLGARAALVRRVREEFEEMPGLSLTLSQASKLFGVSPDACTRILGGLTVEELLAHRSDGRYVLRGGRS